MRGVDTSRVLFDDVRSAEWSDGDTVLAWTAGDPPESGRIDLRKDCYITAAFDDRPASTGLRFKENCLIDGCWRSVDWVESRGGYVYTTPCRVTATGDERVFTELSDPAAMFRRDKIHGTDGAGPVSPVEGHSGGFRYASQSTQLPVELQPGFDGEGPRIEMLVSDDVEAALEKIVPERYLRGAHHWLILHGRHVCKARRPLCEACVIYDLCKAPDRRELPHA